jgi:hypothetical protein
MDRPRQNHPHGNDSDKCRTVVYTAEPGDQQGQVKGEQARLGNGDAQRQCILDAPDNIADIAPRLNLDDCQYNTAHQEAHSVICNETNNDIDKR